ncbi:alpha/beta hydrolase [Mucilaginibacter endophyticus]|uniref:alpha/beta hydrolase n=1 Tax=Mucilaginibacter endophyticus TaxID=2675003 RepID=UPI000E0D3B4B|nr:alpha/beta hydrolase [Mucilaginibacter endophyticus]
MTRLIIAIILLLMALLTVLRAPEFHLWMLAIIVSEFCWVFALIALITFATGLTPRLLQLAGSIICVLAFLLYVSPIMRAYIVSDSLKIDIEKAFPADKNIDDAEPFSLSKLFKSTPHVDHQTLNYATYTDTALTLDFYQSKIKGDRPCVIVVHGGSWSGGDNKQLPDLNSLLAEKGYHVAAINYRLAPKWKSPAPVEDIANCLKHLCHHAAELHLDTAKFILLGRSAGAQIALLAAYTLKSKNIVGVIDFYGPADMVWGYSIPSNPLIMDSRAVMADYVGGTYAQVPEKFKASSPLIFAGHQVPPTLIIHGENDVLVAYDHSRRLNEKLQQLGVAHYWLRLPWATHGFDYVFNGPGGQLSTYAVLHFLNSITR